LTALAHAAAAPGLPAPDFTARDSNGREQSLSAYRGKFVVLEWTNPACPFVRKHYDSTNLPATQKTAVTKGAVWLTVSSTRMGANEYMRPADLANWLQSKGAAPSAVLMDDDGRIARAFGVRATPQLFIVDPAGRLIYSGAIDDRSGTDSHEVRTATNYVNAALGEAMAGIPVTTPLTTPYGCPVKY